VSFIDKDTGSRVSLEPALSEAEGLARDDAVVSDRARALRTKRSFDSLRSLRMTKPFPIAATLRVWLSDGFVTFACRALPTSTLL
jgi:hypothetical protein